MCIFRESYLQLQQETAPRGFCFFSPPTSCLSLLFCGRCRFIGLFAARRRRHKPWRSALTRPTTDSRVTSHAARTLSALSFARSAGRRSPLDVLDAPRELPHLRGQIIYPTVKRVNPRNQPDNNQKCNQRKEQYSCPIHLCRPSKNNGQVANLPYAKHRSGCSLLSRIQQSDFAQRSRFVERRNARQRFAFEELERRAAAR